MARKDPLTKQFDRHTATVASFLDTVDELDDIALVLDQIADEAECNAAAARDRANIARAEAEVAKGRATRFRELLG